MKLHNIGKKCVKAWGIYTFRFDAKTGVTTPSS